jgi:flagellar protein FlaG
MDSLRTNSQISLNKTTSNEKQIVPQEKSIPINEQAKTKALDRKEIDSAVDKANKLLFKNNTHLKFEVHEKTKDVMVKVINNETGETLKEFPPEKILDMVAKLWEIAGLFVDEKR